MKKESILVLIILLSSCNSPTASITFSLIPNENNNIIPQVYFCPHEDCEQYLFNLINSANNSIHCALFDLDLIPIISLLENKSYTTDVKLVTDTDNYENVEHLAFVVQDKRSALMHNKFCIIDSKIIFTGSFNPTENGACKNNNNMLIIESKILAKNYEAEFDEMWQGTFGKGSYVETPVFYLNGIRIENYFCPEDDCAKQIQRYIRKANQSIYFTAFSFTHEGIATDLLLKHYEGLDIRGVFEKTRISQYSQYHKLKYHNISVTMDHNKYVMHHKLIIIDNRTVITGSFNPSISADTRNDENIIIIEDFNLANQFLVEFNNVRNKK